MEKSRWALAAAVVAASLCLPGCDDTGEVDLPPELLGRWTTKAPKYADRYFELRSDYTAVFGLGGWRRDVSPIVHVEGTRLWPAIFVLFTLLAERYERRSVMITSNLVFSQWDQIFKDAMTTAAAIDRVVHHAVILEMTGKSIRSEEAKARNASG